MHFQLNRKTNTNWKRNFPTLILLRSTYHTLTSLYSNRIILSKKKKLASVLPGNKFSIHKCTQDQVTASRPKLHFSRPSRISLLVPHTFINIFHPFNIMLFNIHPRKILQLDKNFPVHPAPFSFHFHRYKRYSKGRKPTPNWHCTNN